MARRSRADATRVPLSRERVIEAALRLADEGGIEAVTMRRVAQQLGVEAMSLYHHVAGKDEILDAITDIVVGEIALPPPDVDWKTALRTSATSAHDVLMRHPWACNFMMLPSRVRPTRIRYIEALLGCLRGAGFSPWMTLHAYHALDSQILGGTLWEVGYTSGARSAGDLPPTFLGDLGIGRLPYLLEHINQHMDAPNHPDRSDFAFGLDLLLDGLERLLP